MYDMLNAYIFLKKERVNERINCTHGEERSDHKERRKHHFTLT